MSIFKIVILIVTAVVYVIPSIIATKRNHRNRMAITVLNIVAGWTLLGWVGSLVWACLKDKDLP